MPAVVRFGTNAVMKALPAFAEHAGAWEGEVALEEEGLESANGLPVGEVEHRLLPSGKKRPRPSGADNGAADEEIEEARLVWFARAAGPDRGSADKKPPHAQEGGRGVSGAGWKHFIVIDDE